MVFGDGRKMMWGSVQHTCIERNALAIHQRLQINTDSYGLNKNKIFNYVFFLRNQILII